MSALAGGNGAVKIGCGAQASTNGSVRMREARQGSRRWRRELLREYRCLCAAQRRTALLSQIRVGGY
jgi:hypothetical protein